MYSRKPWEKRVMMVRLSLSEALFLLPVLSSERMWFGVVTSTGKARQIRKWPDAHSSSSNFQTREKIILNPRDWVEISNLRWLEQNLEDKDCGCGACMCWFALNREMFFLVVACIPHLGQLIHIWVQLVTRATGWACVNDSEGPVPRPHSWDGISQPRKWPTVYKWQHAGHFLSSWSWLVWETFLSGTQFPPGK